MAKLEEVLNEKFSFVRRLPCASGLHRRFEARPRDARPGSESLLLSCAQYAAPLSEDILRQQRQIADRLREPPSPLLMPLLDAVFEPSYHWMISRLPALSSLHEHLRERRRCPLEEVEWLLQVLAPALTAAVAKSWPRFAINTHEVLVHPAARQAALLLPDMPLFGSASQPVADAFQTLVFQPIVTVPGQSELALSNREYILPLAKLCAAMLGESAQAEPASNERFRPLASLSAHQNKVLRTALAGQERQAFKSLPHFVAEFTGIDASVQEAATAIVPPVAPVSAPVPPPLPAVAPPPLPPATLPGYVLDGEAEGAGPCRTRAGTHASHGAVLVTTVDLSMEVAELTRRLPALLSALRTADAARIATPLEVISEGRYLHVVRAKPARRLLDALRQTQALPKPVVARVLASIHHAYECLWNLVGRRIVAMSLDQFWLPDTEQAPDAPPADVRLDAAQVLLDHEFKPQSASRPIEHYARLTLCLLGHDGGALAGAASERFSPLPELSAATNELLRGALDPARTGELSIPDFLARLTAALAGHTAISELRRKNRLNVAAAFAGREAEPLRRVRLMPDQKDNPILALTGAEAVLLGRSAAHADFAAQFAPRNPVNDSRTRAISRVQVKAWVNGGQFMLEDIAEANPSLIEKQRLDKAAAVDLPVTVLLGSEYPAEIRACRTAYPPGTLVVDGWPEAEKRPLPRRGACLVLPAVAGALKFELGWLFTDVGLTVADEAGVVHLAAADDPACAARIHSHAGALWLEAVSSGVVIRVADTVLAPGELAPLAAQDIVAIGPTRFQVQPFQPEACS